MKINYYDDKKFPYSSTRQSLGVKVVRSVKAKRVLVLLPHPDDEAFGCGGLIKHLSEEGAQVKALYFSDGAKGNKSGQREQKLIRQREEETIESLRVLKVSEVNFLRLKDGEIAQDKKVWLRLLEELKTGHWELILVPGAEDWNKDHIAVNEIFAKEFKKIRKNKPKVWYYYVWGIGKPNIIFPIDKYLRYKKEAISCHKSQLKVKPYHQAAIAANEFLGKALGVSDYAEGYLEE